MPNDAVGKARLFLFSSGGGLLTERGEILIGRLGCLLGLSGTQYPEKLGNSQNACYDSVSLFMVLKVTWNDFYASARQLLLSRRRDSFGLEIVLDRMCKRKHLEKSCQMKVPLQQSTLGF